MNLNTFWQANFWGILGSISGGTGVLISWLTFKYNTPKVEIDKMYLIVPDDSAKSWKNYDLNNLKNCVLEYELEIVVRNKSGGSGSIDKPNLLIKIPLNKKFLKRKFETISINPKTQHTEYERESETTTKTWTVRHGKAFNLGAGEKVDEKLEYMILDEPEKMQKIVQNLDKIEYEVEYWDNKGKKHNQRIKQLINDSDRY